MKLAEMEMKRKPNKVHLELPRILEVTTRLQEVTALGREIVPHIMPLIATNYYFFTLFFVD